MKVSDNLSMSRNKRTGVARSTGASSQETEAWNSVRRDGRKNKTEMSPDAKR